MAESDESMCSEEAREAFGGMLDELGLEYATDRRLARYIVPTETGLGIVAEFAELGDGSSCVVLIVPLLRDVPTAIDASAAVFALREGSHMLMAKIVADENRRTVELRYELPLQGTDPVALGIALGGLSTHSAKAERLEQVFGGKLGPSYDELIDGQ